MNLNKIIMFHHLNGLMMILFFFFFLIIKLSSHYCSFVPDIRWSIMVKKLLQQIHSIIDSIDDNNDDDDDGWWHCSEFFFSFVNHLFFGTLYISFFFHIRNHYHHHHRHYYRDLLANYHYECGNFFSRFFFLIQSILTAWRLFVCVCRVCVVHCSLINLSFFFHCFCFSFHL